MRKLLILPLLVCALLCGGCKHLETGGAYAPVGQQADMTLYTADAAFKMAYATLDAVFLFEKNNRQMLWDINPNIKQQVDNMRTIATQYIKDWAVARSTYCNNPIEPNLKGLQAVLAKIQQLSQVASVVIVRYQNP
jgi:hypothetical protein